jgi:protein-disulfide isomerase
MLGLTVVLQATILYSQYNQRPRRPDPVRDAPKDTVVEVTDMPILGSHSAQTVLIEFSDYECPYCRRHATEVLHELKKRFVDTGAIRYAFANNPLESHANAKMLAKAAICAGRQRDYWTAHDSLFRLQPKTESEVLAAAKEIGIEPDPFVTCLRDDIRAADRIEADLGTAKRLGLMSTPSFAIGRMIGTGRVQIEKFVIGAQDMSVFDAIIGEIAGS